MPGIFELTILGTGGGGGGASTADTFITATTNADLTNQTLIGTVIQSGTLAGRPAATTVPAGSIYNATDTGVIYRSNGTTWSSFTILDATKLAIANNLSDVASANTSLNNILPSQTNNQGKALISDNGTNTAWNYPALSGTDSAQNPSDSIGDTISRAGITQSSAVTLTSATLYVVPLWLSNNKLLTSIRVGKGGTAVSSATHQIFGVYDNNKNLLRGTVDDTSTAWALNAMKTLALTSTFTTTYTGLYWIGILVVATTPGTLASGANYTAAAALGTNLAGNTSSTGLSALPASFTTITAGPSAYAGVI